MIPEVCSTYLRHPLGKAAASAWQKRQSPVGQAINACLARGGLACRWGASQAGSLLHPLIEMAHGAERDASAFQLLQVLTGIVVTTQRDAQVCSVEPVVGVLGV